MTRHDALWHFAAKTLRDGSPLPPPGHMSCTIEAIEPCVQGWHASARAIDALRYAPGSMVARVRLHGHTIEHGSPVDKIVAQRRETVTGYVDATGAMRDHARWCARSVLHLWDAPDVVESYLETGDESLRAAAWAAARAAARAAQNADLESRLWEILP